MIETLRLENVVIFIQARKDLRFNTRALNCKELENIIFDILLRKSKPITIGVFYRAPNQSNFMELAVKSFSLLNLKDS